MPPKSAKSTPSKGATPVPTQKVEPAQTVSTIDELVSEPVVDASVSIDPLSGRKLAYPLPKGISPTTIENTQSFLRILILGLIAGAAVGSRLFAVIRFESVIHEL